MQKRTIIAMPFQFHMKLKYTSILLIFLYSYLGSQTDATISRLTVNDGLSQGLILDMIQSRDGFIWIATKDGLNRYDGTKFKVFSVDPFDPFAISAGDVHCLFEDSHGWIWVAHTEGVDILDPVRGLFFHLDIGKKLADVNSIAETDNGNIWLGLHTEILSINLNKDVLDQALKSKRPNLSLHFSSISLQDVKDWSQGELFANRLYYSHSKSLLVATNHGLFKIDPSTNIITPEFPMFGFTMDWMVENKSGDRLMQVENGTESKWVRISNGAITYNKSKIPNVGFHGLDDNGYAWLVLNNAVEKWKPSEFMNGGKPEITVFPGQIGLEGNNGFGYTCLMIDQSGIIWLGTSGFGIIKINENGQKFKTILPGTSHRAVLEDMSGAIYTIDAYRHIYVKNFNENLPNTELTIATERVMAYDQEGNLWWITDKLNRRDAKSGIITSFPFMDVLSLIFDGNGRPIGVSENGLHRFDPATQMRQDFPFDHTRKKMNDYSYFLYKDVNEVIWIYSLEGLISATPIASGFQYHYYVNHPEDINSLSTNTVLSVQDDPIEPNRFLWVGTKGGGLNRLEKSTGRFKKYSRQQGLPDNVIYGILAEDKPKDNTESGYIWLSTNHGLCRFDVRQETVKNFTVADGLQANEFNAPGYLKTRDGHFIFAGVNGINMFHPDSLNFNEHLPLVQIVGLKVNNTETPFSGHVPLEFSHDQNLLNFEFAALEFTNPTKNQYRYQLLGVGKGWVDLGNKNNVQFANLAPGEYTFRVRGSNNDGQWSKDFAELRFRINSPWYATWWAYMFYAGMISLGLSYLYKYQLRQKLKLEETARLREMDEFKSKFFTNITHEFRTPLTLILGMSDQLAQNEKDNDSQKKIGLIKRNGENLLRLVNQILDLSKLESNALQLQYQHADVLAYLKYIAESLHSLANAQNLMLRVESDQAKIEMDYDPDRLLQIMYNLLSNAIKFTPSGGKIIVQANQKDQWLHISVADTGVGISEHELPYLFDRFFQARNQDHAKAGGTGIGLALTSELIKAMGGTIKAESKTNTGTKFLVRLPITHQAPIESTNARFEDKLPGSSALDDPNLMAPIDPYQSGLQGPQILLIEDNPDVVEYLTYCLKQNFQLEFAFNGKAGIEKALSIVPDLIISDVMMPIKDGFEVLDALKHDERTSHIPIILLTAKADIQSRLTGLRKGADGYLAKPFHQEELIVVTENLLETRTRLQLKYQQNQWITPAPAEQASEDMEDAFLQKFRKVVEANMSDADLEMPRLERALSMSRSQIYRKIKALTDKSPSLLIRSIRLHHGRHLLLTTQLSVSEIAYSVGYNAVNNFSDAYLDEFGERPSKSR